jgi:hypothetical protein
VGLITGILLILLAFWVSGSDRVYALAQRTYLILFWVGFFALFKGIMQIVLAFGVRHAGKEAETASAMGQTEAGTHAPPSGRPTGRGNGGHAIPVKRSTHRYPDLSRPAWG